MKRWHMEGFVNRAGQNDVKAYEDPEGEWVSWRDAGRIIHDLKALLYQLQLLDRGVEDELVEMFDPEVPGTGWEDYRGPQ